MELNNILFTLISVASMVEAVADPLITPPAKLLMERQNGAVSGFWSPVLNGSTTQYSSIACSAGQYIETYGANWGCCNPTGDACTPGTLCYSGTIYYSTFSVDCASSLSNAEYTRCGTLYLYSSSGALAPLTHLYCAAPADPPAYTFYVQSPNAPTTATATSSSASSGGSSSPAPSSGSSTPIGAIVGGVIGGIAVIAIAAAIIFFLFRRKPVGATAGPTTDQKAPVVDPSMGTSPPPMYQTHAGYYQPGQQPGEIAAVAGAGAAGYQEVKPGMAVPWSAPPPQPVEQPYGVYGAPQQPVMHTYQPGVPPSTQPYGGVGAGSPLELSGTGVYPTTGSPPPVHQGAT